MKWLRLILGFIITCIGYLILANALILALMVGAALVIGEFAFYPRRGASKMREAVHRWRYAYAPHVVPYPTSFSSNNTDHTS
jgi:hypothetical protein